MVHYYYNLVTVPKRLETTGQDQWRTQGIFSGEGVQQIQLRTEDGENRDLGMVAP